MRLFVVVCVGVALALGAGGCGNVAVAPSEPDGAVPVVDSSVVDSSVPDAPVPHVGPPGRGYSAGGRRSVSARFVLYSVTGQPTPVGVGLGHSPRFAHAPGIL